MKEKQNLSNVAGASTTQQKLGKTLGTDEPKTKTEKKEGDFEIWMGKD